MATPPLIAHRPKTILKRLIQDSKKKALVMRQIGREIAEKGQEFVDSSEDSLFLLRTVPPSTDYARLATAFRAFIDQQERIIAHLLAVDALCAPSVTEKETP